MDKIQSLKLKISLAMIIVASIVLFQPATTQEGTIQITATTTTATTTATKKAEEIPTPKLKPVLPIVTEALKKIAWCESKNLQFNPDGTVHRGVINHQDVGKYQINEHYHLEASQKLGMDIYTLEGNTAYANYLYQTQGTTPWNWSRPCWGDPARVWIERGLEYWSH